MARGGTNNSKSTWHPQHPNHCCQQLLVGWTWGATMTTMTMPPSPTILTHLTGPSLYARSRPPTLAAPVSQKASNSSPLCSRGFSLGGGEDARWWITREGGETMVIYTWYPTHGAQGVQYVPMLNLSFTFQLLGTYDLSDEYWFRSNLSYNTYC